MTSDDETAHAMSVFKYLLCWFCKCLINVLLITDVVKVYTFIENDWVMF